MTKYPNRKQLLFGKSTRSDAKGDYYTWTKAEHKRVDRWLALHEPPLKSYNGRRPIL